MLREVAGRVARWFIFIPKNPNLDIFWRALEWKMLVYFMLVCWIFGIFYNDLVFLWSLRSFFSFLVYRNKKNLATLAAGLVSILRFFSVCRPDLLQDLRSLFGQILQPVHRQSNRADCQPDFFRLVVGHNFLLLK
jgi:hypothetical protein